MKTRTINTAELLQAFPGWEAVQKVDLRGFYQQRKPDLTEQAFRRVVYALEKQQVILPLGAGVYALLPLSPAKKKFVPVLSAEIETLSSALREGFPYVDFLLWETRLLHEFMIHQPVQNQVIVETEKDTGESVFNFLNERYPGRVFLDPDQVTMERYVAHQPESILVMRLVTRSPKKKVGGVPYPSLEKILVDVFADREPFFTFQGQELVNIFDNAFAGYWINEKTLWHYAGRRRVTDRLMEFIRQKTQVELARTAPHEDGE